jgi:phenylacetate-CoA ligase
MDAAALLIRHALFPAWVRKNRSARLSYLRELEKSQFYTEDAIRDLQWAQLKDLLAHAFERCPFYRRKFSAAGLRPGDIKSLDDVAMIPTTSKREVQEHRLEFVAEGFRPRELVEDMTGGSTGSPTVFYYDRDRLDSRMAATFRHDRWARWDIGEKVALLWGAPRDTAAPVQLKYRLRDWIIGRRLTLDASVIDDDRMRDFARRLVEYQPHVIQAYANTMGLFARFLRNEGMNNIRPEGIICSAEVLTEENRRLIEETFSCPVFNRYGSREFAVIASECGGSGPGMHINAENLLVEVVDNEGPCVGRDGEVVITDLKNRAMPLIRYRTMDVGRLVQGPCDCGRGLPLMELGGGRVTDFLVAAQGHRVSGIVVATYVITGVPGIRQVQFVQDRAGGVKVRLSRGPGWSEDSLGVLTARIRRFLGSSMSIDLEFVDEIPAETSGKYRFSICTLSQ